MTRIVRFTYSRENPSTPWSHEALLTAAETDSVLAESYSATLEKCRSTGSNRVASGCYIDQTTDSAQPEKDLWIHIYYPDLPDTEPANLTAWALNRQRKMFAEELAEAYVEKTNPITGTVESIGTNYSLDWIRAYRVKNHINLTKVEIIEI